MRCSLALLCALEIEASPIIQAFKMQEKRGVLDWRLNLRHFSSAASLKLSLILFGKCPTSNVDRIGTQIASLACWETIAKIRPQIIASVGTAGGYQAKGAQIGDVFISKTIYFHGRHIPAPSYQSFELGAFKTRPLRIPSPIKKGIISTSDSVPVSKNDQIKIEVIGTDAKDMEAAAIAEVAQLAGIPMFALKSISDFVDSPKPTHHQFMDNHKIATANLTEALQSLISTNALI